MRLTNQLRDKIVQDVVDAVTGKEKADLIKRENALAIQLYNDLYPKKIRDLMAGLPDGFMPEDKCLRFNLGGMNIQIKAKEKVRVPWNPLPDGRESDYRNSCQRLGNIANDELQAKYLTLHADKEKHTERTNKVGSETKALLYSLHTYGQLVKTWPEGAKFYSKYEPVDGESQLPAILISELNKTLGIS